jgi:UDP-N-acetylglucosamine 4-epimerase
MFKYKFHNQDLSQSKFLITGGAGFIGSNITEYLIKHKAGFVRVLDNLSTGNIQNIEKHIDHSNFEFIDGDIRDFEICKKATENIDYVTHQAALGSVPRSIKDPLLTNSVNISGFLNILTAAKEEKGLKKFIYAASSSTYGDHPGLPKIEEKIGQPLSPYAITKYVNELYGDVFSRIYNFHSIGLRYFNVFGPNQSPDNPYAAVIPLFLRAAKMKINPIINGDGNTSRDFTYVENAVEANIKALLNTKDVNSHEVLNIAFGAQTSLRELWEIICSISKLSIKPEFREERIGDVKHSLAEISKAKRLIGYDPKVNIKKGLELTIDSYK